MADAILTTETKICTRCGESKPLATAFYVSPKGRRESWCRDCTAVYRVEYYEKNRDSIKERRGPQSREYQRRRRETDPVVRAKSILAVREFWNSLTAEEKTKLNRKKKLLKRYGLTIEQWESMKLAQRGACAICEEVPSSERHFHVDHDHKTGKVRGLLCLRCNTALAWFERVSDRTHRVLKYLGVGDD